MTEQWQELKETITEMHDSNGTCTQQEVCKFLVNYMEILEKQMQEPKSGHWNCGDDMFEYAICSSCKHETGEAWEYAKRNFKYCPNCGAKMQKVKE